MAGMEAGPTRWVTCTPRDGSEQPLEDSRLLVGGLPCRTETVPVIPCGSPPQLCRCPAQHSSPLLWRKDLGDERPLRPRVSHLPLLLPTHLPSNLSPGDRWILCQERRGRGSGVLKDQSVRQGSGVWGPQTGEERTSGRDDGNGQVSREAGGSKGMLIT